MLSAQKRFFDKLALIFLIAHLFFLVSNWQRYPTELDTPYHLLMGKMFADKGQIPEWDDYEFAPLGRAQLYPPMQHIIVWFAHKSTNLAYMDIGRLIAVLQTILGLFAVWFFSRRFFNPGAALFAVIFFAANTEMWWWQTSVAPISLACVLYLPFIYLYYKKKIFLPIVILAFCLYLHYGLALIMVATVLIAALSDGKYLREYLKNFFIIFGTAILLFLPWLLRIYKFRGQVFNRCLDLKTLDLFSLRIGFHEIFLHFNAVLWLFLPFGLFYCYKHRQKDFKYSLLLAGFWSYFAFLFLFQGVRFNAHTPIVTSVLAGLGFYLVMRRTEYIKRPLAGPAVRMFLALLVLACVFFEFHFLTPHLLKLNKRNIALMGLKRSEAVFRPTPLSNEIMSLGSGAPLKGKHTVRVQHFFSDEDMPELLACINSSIPKDAILHIYDGAIADYITLETGRRSDWGMFFEMVSPELMTVIGANLREGYYISTDPYFKELIPGEYKKMGKFPSIMKRIGKFYIGYIQPANLGKD
jgi:hypothetical protein